MKKNIEKGEIKMRNKTFSVIYGLVLVMMIAAAYLVAIDALSPNAAVVVAALAVSVAAAIVTDIIFMRSMKKSHLDVVTD